jgi:hypothetical protein
MSSVPVVSPSLPLYRRVIGIMVSPRAVFANLREHPRVLGALLLLVAVNLIATFFLLDIIAQDQATAMESRPGMTEQQRETALKMVKITPVFAAAGNLVVVFALAGLYLFLANIVLGGSTNYKTLLSAVSHIGLVAIPSSIVRVPLMLAKGTTQMTLSPAAFLPADGEKGFLFHLLSQLDIFSLWMIGLSALAVSVIAGVPTRKATITVCAMWAVLFLVLAPFGSKFNPGG